MNPSRYCEVGRNTSEDQKAIPGNQCTSCVSQEESTGASCGLQVTERVGHEYLLGSMDVQGRPPNVLVSLFHE